MTMYVYNPDTMQVITVIHGTDNEECEAIADDMGYNDDQYGWTYCDMTT